jgi:hypothetical protein
MKKNLLIIGLSVLTIAGIAQPTLTSTNTNGVIGDQFNFQAGSWINQGGSGASQTWNFLAVTASTAAVSVSSISAVTSGNAINFPNANQQLNTGANAGMNKASSTANQNYGIVSGTVNIIYSDPEDQMRYPFSMGSSYSDPFYATFSSAGSNYVRKGTTSLNADAYGTLQLPGGTYSNVLRIHLTQNYSDSTNFGGTFPYVITYNNDMYMWYLPNNHQPIFSTYAIAVNGGTPQKSSNTLVNATNGISEISTSVKSLNFYPNPNSGNTLNLDLNLNDNIKYNIIISDNLGREILKTESTNGFAGYNFNTINISSLENGIYHFEIVSENLKLVSKKIIIQK